jgi:signal transduction histidine kinase
MLYDFLIHNQKEVLAMTETKTLELAGVRPSSEQLREGLPIFYKQLLEVLRLQEKPRTPSKSDKKDMAKAASESDEPALAEAAGNSDDAAFATAAGVHGTELLRLGYTLSHVVHAYGAMCQAITELATNKKIHITSNEFHDLNRCLDTAIAGAVTGYQSRLNIQEKSREVEHLGFLAHELRNCLTSVNISLQLIKKGTVGFGGNTGKLLEKGLHRLEELVDRSLTEVRLRVDPKIHAESEHLLQLVDQIILTAEIEARLKAQTFEIQIDPNLVIVADQQLMFSALSNLIQNAIKYSRSGAKIQVRGKSEGEKIVFEVEDECGGLSDSTVSLFKPFEQHHENRNGLGLGLTIAQRAIALNYGTIDLHDLPGKGCIFRVTLPKTLGQKKLEPAA